MNQLKPDSGATTTARRTRSRRGEGDKLREDIIDAVERLLLETGDESLVSMRAIAKAVGVTPPALYMHFEDKDSMIEAVCDRRFRELNELMGVARESTDDPVEGLKLMGKAYIRFGTDNPEPYRLLMMSKTEIDHGESLTTAEPTEGDLAFIQLVSQVSACIESGRFKAADPLETSLIVWSSVHGLTALMISQPNFVWPSTVVDRLVEMVVAGLAP